MPSLHDISKFFENITQAWRAPKPMGAEELLPITILLLKTLSRENLNKLAKQLENITRSNSFVAGSKDDYYITTLRAAILAINQNDNKAEESEDVKNTVAVLIMNQTIKILTALNNLDDIANQMYCELLVQKTSILNYIKEKIKNTQLHNQEINSNFILEMEKCLSGKNTHLNEPLQEQIKTVASNSLNFTRAIANYEVLDRAQNILSDSTKPNVATRLNTLFQLNVEEELHSKGNMLIGSTVSGFKAFFRKLWNRFTWQFTALGKQQNQLTNNMQFFKKLAVQIPKVQTIQPSVTPILNIDWDSNQRSVELISPKRVF